MLEIITFVLGPVKTNTYLVADPISGKSVVIDPAWDGHKVIEKAGMLNWSIESMWFTHAHFDHIGGAAVIAEYSSPGFQIALHPDDLPLWQVKGGAAWFGISLQSTPLPTISLRDKQHMSVGEYEFIVLHTPGHTPGHVLYWCPAQTVAFVGDLIFKRGIGRTDLPGGDMEKMQNSIISQVFTLPDHTRLLSGHGPETTVRDEKKYNPFL